MTTPEIQAVHGRTFAFPIRRMIYPAIYDGIIPPVEMKTIPVRWSLSWPLEETPAEILLAAPKMRNISIRQSERRDAARIDEKLDPDGSAWVHIGRDPYMTGTSRRRPLVVEEENRDAMLWQTICDAQIHTGITKIELLRELPAVVSISVYDQTGLPARSNQREAELGLVLNAVQLNLNRVEERWQELRRKPFR